MNKRPEEGGGARTGKQGRHGIDERQKRDRSVHFAEANHMIRRQMRTQNVLVTVPHDARTPRPLPSPNPAYRVAPSSRRISERATPPKSS